ncbi:MAG TPA: DsrE family protein [Xanthomonadales bacterium]|nr:DsrE family protein [Xanthomonadales bacterium]
MKFIFVINESPWGSTLPSSALRIAERVLEANHDLAVFFREDGVYNVVAGTVSDSGTDDLAGAWLNLGETDRVDLMVCQASLARRLAETPKMPFRPASLVELTDLLSDCDRVVTF